MNTLEDYHIQLSDNMSILGVGKITKEGIFEMSGMQPACTAQTIASNISDGDILFIADKPYLIMGTKVLSENCLHVFYKEDK